MYTRVRIRGIERSTAVGWGGCGRCLPYGTEAISRVAIREWRARARRGGDGVVAFWAAFSVCLGGGVFGDAFVGKAWAAGPSEVREGKASESSWVGIQWGIRAESIERDGEWIAFEDAVLSSLSEARTDAGASARGGWTVRADRVVARLASPGRIAVWRAEGRVRVIGEAPMYVTGDRAVSFRPGRSVTVLGRERAAQLHGGDWRFAGERIEVDFRARSATVVDSDTAESL